MTQDRCEIHYRRASNRFRVDASATLVCDNKQEEPVIVKNISARGGGIVGNCPLKKDAKVGIVIQHFLLGNPVRKEARVAWCRQINDRLWEGGLDFGIDTIEFT